MIIWPDLQLPPINLWSLPYANQSRRFGVGMEKCNISQSGQSGNQGNRGGFRPTYSQSADLWATIKAHR